MSRKKFCRQNLKKNWKIHFVQSSKKSETMKATYVYRNNLSKMTKVYPWSWEVYPRSREATKKIANLKRFGKNNCI